MLERLSIPFVVDSPEIDETRGDGECAEDLVRRLAIDKAHTVGNRHPTSLVIGSDQVLVMDGEILGKPGNFANNVRFLTRAAGRRVVSCTGLCLLDAQSGRAQAEVVEFSVTFRRLVVNQIEAYVRRETPFDCAGGFKAEGLGIALFQSVCGEDPSALIGLPLIALIRMLAEEGVDVLTEV